MDNHNRLKDARAMKVSLDQKFWICVVVGTAVLLLALWLSFLVKADFCTVPVRYELVGSVIVQPALVIVDPAKQVWSKYQQGH